MRRCLPALIVLSALCLFVCAQAGFVSPSSTDEKYPTFPAEPPVSFAPSDDTVVAFSVEGSDNNFFGTGAGAVNIGVGNSFFGGQAGFFNSSGNYNSLFGKQAGYSNNTGTNNSFFGIATGYSNSTGSYNSFFGGHAGYFNTTGHSNAFFGRDAGFSNTEGFDNVFFGRNAGRSNTTGRMNAFVGKDAGHQNTTGSWNSFFGEEAGYSNTTGWVNSFVGWYAGWANTTGYENCFFGVDAGMENSEGRENSFFGTYVGNRNTTGDRNVFLGWGAGYSNTVENSNTLVGYSANLNPGLSPATNPVQNATAIGALSIVSQSNSLVLGSIAGLNDATSYVNVGIGTPAPARQLHLAGPNAVFRMDRSADTAAFIMVRTDVSGNPMKSFVVGTNAAGVNQGEFIINDIGNAVGGLGNRRMTITNDGAVQFTGSVSAPGFVTTSSIAFKTNVQTYENALETVNRLRGVRFDWKDSGKPAVGLIAEEVDQVIPELVSHEDGAARGVSYANLVAVLVEAVKEQQATIQSQQRAIELHQQAISTSEQRHNKEIQDLKSRFESLEALLNRMNKRF